MEIHGQILLEVAPPHAEAWEVAEVEHMRKRLQTDTRLREDGVWVWSFGAAVPPSAFSAAWLIAPDKQAAAVDADVARFFKDEMEAEIRCKNASTREDILFALERLENKLTPENLSCDGVFSGGEIQVRKSQLLSEKKRLQACLKNLPPQGSKA
jgi:hypothetical protein